MILPFETKIKYILIHALTRGERLDEFCCGYNTTHFHIIQIDNIMICFFVVYSHQLHQNVAAWSQQVVACQERNREQVLSFWLLSIGKRVAYMFKFFFPHRSGMHHSQSCAYAKKTPIQICISFTPRSSVWLECVSNGTTRHEICLILGSWWQAIMGPLRHWCMVLRPILWPLLMLQVLHSQDKCVSHLRIV